MGQVAVRGRLVWGLGARLGGLGARLGHLEGMNPGFPVPTRQQREGSCCWTWSVLICADSVFSLPSGISGRPR